MSYLWCTRCFRLWTFALAASLVVSSIQSSSCSRRSRECFMSSTSSCTWKGIIFTLKEILKALKIGLLSQFLTLDFVDDEHRTVLDISSGRYLYLWGFFPTFVVPLLQFLMSVVCNVNSHHPVCNYHRPYVQLKHSTSHKSFNHHRISISFQK